MKNIFTLCASFLIIANTFAQAPEKMSYQAVVLDNSGALVVSSPVGMQISILQGSIIGPAVYVETHTPTSNVNGLVSLEIGAGTTTDDFSLIDWAAGPYFIKIETDPTGGTSYTITGTSQLLSVPYALYAETAENVVNGFSGDYNDLTNQPVLPTNVSDLTNDAGYLTSFTEVDGSPTNEIQTLTVIGNIATLSLGGGAIAIPDCPTNLGAFTNDVGYLTSFTEMDANPTNELNTGFNLVGTNLSITDAGGTQTVSLASIGGGVYTAGTGITITSNVIEATSPTYTIGYWPELGGYVFWVSTDGKHGLVAEIQDQASATWYDAQNLNSNPSNHSVNGQKFRDWRLPTSYELNEMYLNSSAINAAAISNGGTNFVTNRYWSVSESGANNAWDQNFLTGAQNLSANKGSDVFVVRAVRAF